MITEESILQQNNNGWWVVCDDIDVMDMGPYKTKTEAEEAQRGLGRFLKYGHLKSFITSEKG